MIIYLGVLLPTPSCSLPGRITERAAPNALLGLAPGGVCLASDITAAAGGLLHRRFTLATSRSWQQYASLLHLPSGRPARLLAGTALCGVRTFLSSQMSPFSRRDHPASLVSQIVTGSGSGCKFGFRGLRDWRLEIVNLCQSPISNP